jgi:hypothetical protein
MDSELQIAYQYSELRSIFWNFVLYWTSVSFGLMIAAHVAAKNLHTIVIALITLLYVSFSVWMGFAMFTNSTIISGFMSDLKSMGELKSHGVAAILAVHEMSDKSSIPATTFLFAAGGTFTGTIMFLWYSHLRKERNA